MFINTTENTIHRLDINGETKEWVIIGGSGAGSFMPVGEELSVSGDIYYNQRNVGIGNNNPQYKLDITGALKANSLNSTKLLPPVFKSVDLVNTLEYSDANNNDTTGWSVDVDGNYVIIGAPEAIIIIKALVLMVKFIFIILTPGNYYQL